MSGLSFSIRVVLCCLVAFAPLSSLDQWLSDLFFRLRGPLGSPSTLALVPLASEEQREAVLQHIQQDGPQLLVSYPDEALQEDTVPDPDCTLRHASLEGGGIPSPTLLTYHRLIGTSGKPSPQFPVAIDFRGPAGSYFTVPESQVATSATGTFRDKIVLVGRDRGEQQATETPFGKMSPLEVQANTLETLWQDRRLSPVPHWISILGTLVSIAVSVGLILQLPLRLAWIPLTALAGLWLGAGAVLLGHWKLSLGIANPLVGILSTHFFLFGFKVKQREALFWQTKREADYARQLDEFKNNFVSLFSHDLKTPIARIKAVVQLALSEGEGVPQKAQDALRNIDRASDDLGRLIGDILKVTKMESMSMELQRDAVDVNRMVELAVARLRFAADDKKIQFVLDLEPLFPIEGDPQLIQEIILNLVENAVKYGKPSTQVMIRTCEELGRVRVTVSDHGVGIPTDELPRVTGKFYRGKEAAKTSSGSGLGLYLAKYFVELHHGGLELKSEVGRGTQVSVWLPSPS